MLNDFEKINIRPFNDHSMLGETLELNKKAADWFKEAQKRMESCQKWHDIVQKDMQPLFDNLNVIKTQFAPGNPDVRKIDDMQKNNQLVIEALAFIRGRSLSETYCIIDEAQNLTPHEIKTIITRAGEGTKMVFTGDIQQIDSPYLDAQSNGLAYMIDKMKGQDLFAHINLIKGERSELSELASDLL